MTTPVSAAGYTPPVGALPGTTAAAAASGTTGAGAVDPFGKDTFLKLLVAQLKYQNPDSPTDGTQYLAETAQFTQVEKLDELASSVSQLLAAQQATSAASLLGKQVGWPDGDSTRTGVVTGVTTTAAGPSLRVQPSTGGAAVDVPLTSVQSVTQAPATTTPAPTPATTTTPGTPGTTGTTASPATPSSAPAASQEK